MAARAQPDTLPRMKLRTVILALGVVVGGAGLLCSGAVWSHATPAFAVPATVENDPTLPSITADGVMFHSESFGAASRPTVVVLHGGPGGDYRNLLVLAELADDYHVVFYDQRGTGLSPRVPEDQLTLQSSVEDVHRVVLHAAGGAPVALIGHSWGGMLGAYYLAEHPEMVARAVLAEPGVLTSTELQEFVTDVQPPITPGMVAHMAQSVLEMTHVDGPDDHAAMDYLVARVMTAPSEDNPMNGYWCDRQPPSEAHDIWRIGSTSMTAILGQALGNDGLHHLPILDASDYTAEVLLLASSCNTLIGVERQTDHLALFPNARLETIESAGHLMFTDQPAHSLSVVRAYLADWPAPTPEPSP